MQLIERPSPLRLKVGDRLVHINGRVLEVTQVDEIAGTLSYETSSASQARPSRT